MGVAETSIDLRPSDRGFCHTFFFPERFWRFRVGPVRALTYGMTPQELRDRTAGLAARVEAFTRPLLRRIETREAALQLSRSSSSVASNYRAAGTSRSHAEFTAKIGTVLEEADESQFWLEHLRRCGLVTPEHGASLLAEAGELVAIFTTASQTAQNREKVRPGYPPKRRRRR